MSSPLPQFPGPIGPVSGTTLRVDGGYPATGA